MAEFQGTLVKGEDFRVEFFLSNTANEGYTAATTSNASFTLIDPDGNTSTPSSPTFSRRTGLTNTAIYQMVLRGSDFDETGNWFLHVYPKSTANLFVTKCFKIYVVDKDWLNFYPEHEDILRKCQEVARRNGVI